jgi:hypothetical protein
MGDGRTGEALGRVQGPEERLQRRVQGLEERLQALELESTLRAEELQVAQGLR